MAGWTRRWRASAARRTRRKTTKRSSPPPFRTMRVEPSRPRRRASRNPASALRARRPEGPPMKPWFAPACLLLFSAPTPTREGVALRFAPEEGTVLKRMFEAKAEYHLADLTTSVDGEALPEEGELPAYTTGFS